MLNISLDILPLKQEFLKIFSLDINTNRPRLREITKIFFFFFCFCFSNFLQVRVLCEPMRPCNRYAVLSMYVYSLHSYVYSVLQRSRRRTDVFFYSPQFQLRKPVSEQMLFIFHYQHRIYGSFKPISLHSVSQYFTFSGN